MNYLVREHYLVKYLNDKIHEISHDTYVLSVECSHNMYVPRKWFMQTNVQRIQPWNS